MYRTCVAKAERIREAAMQCLLGRQSTEQDMSDTWVIFRDLKTGRRVPGSASTGRSAALPAAEAPHAFIMAAQSRTLRVTTLKTPAKRMTDEQRAALEALREKYAVLLSKLPPNVYEKLTEDELRTPDGRSRALTQLVSLHSGDIVELCRQRTIWHLRKK